MNNIILTFLPLVIEIDQKAMSALHKATICGWDSIVQQQIIVTHFFRKQIILPRHNHIRRRNPFDIIGNGIDK